MIFDKTPLYAIFILYLIISGNFLAQLFPCRLQHLLNTSMLAKNVLGFLTLLFFVVIAGNQQYSFREIWIYTIVIYLLFMASTRMSQIPFYLFMLICGTLYVIQLYEVNNKMERKKETLEQIKKAKLWLTVVAIIVLITGVIMYIIEKQFEYNKNFKYAVFLMGKPVCKHSSPRISIKKLLSRSGTKA